jgi:osmotically-inducible protein OsmY
MAWLLRIFGIKHDDAPAGGTATATATAEPQGEVPPERKGLNGEYDQSGLAKRVVKAFDDAGIEDAPHLYVEQHDTTVVFTGHVKEQSILDQLEEVAKGVEGATAVDASKVTIE